MKKTKILGKYELLLILVICVLLLVFGAKKTGGDIKQSNIPRDTSPQVSDTDIQNLVSRNTDFAFDLYRILAENEDGNLFYSPYSISTVSAMIYSGANGETKQEIKDIFHFDLPEEALHSSFNAFDLNLKQDILVSTNADGLDSPPKLKLEFINALWVQKGFPFEKVFLDNLAENYGAGARILDFIKHPEKSRQAINEWVSEKTNGLIQETFPEEMIDHRARVVIVNSFLFDAAWSYIDFIPYNGKFTLLDNSEISVPMMSAVDYFGYYEDENFTAVEIPYYDYLHSLIIVSPKNSIFEEIEETINSSFFQSLQGNLTYPSYKLNIPKFSFETNLDF